MHVDELRQVTSPRSKVPAGSVPAFQEIDVEAACVVYSRLSDVAATHTCEPAAHEMPTMSELLPEGTESSVQDDPASSVDCGTPSDTTTHTLIEAQLILTGGLYP